MVFVLPFSGLKDKATKIIAPVTPFEKELVTGLKAGNKKAIDLLYKKYSAALFGIIVRIVKYDEIAEDTLQDTFLKIWKSIGQYDSSKGKLFTWMANLAKNTAIDQIRSKHYTNGIKTDDIAETAVENCVQGIQKPLNLDAIGLKQLMFNLKPDQKQIIDLFYFEGYTHIEVAEKLDMPLGTVKTKIRQAIIILRQYFNETNRGLNPLSA